MTYRKESMFQNDVKELIRKALPGSYIFKMNGGSGTGNPQGIPDLLILYKSKWAALECKLNSKAERQPNQETYVADMNIKAFARFIFPENVEEVIDELEDYFKF